MFHQELNGKWTFHQSGETEWLPATVPGGVHTDLLALGRIPDPFVSDNEKKVQWIAEKDWEYRRSFTVDAALAKEEKIFLVCDGLDTLAEVSLNDKLLGKADNLFRAWKWELTSLLKKGENEIRILFRAPLTFITARQAEQALPGGGDLPGGPHLRKAPFQWGWDWGPKLPPIGIWKSIRLEGYSTAKLEDVLIRQAHHKGTVTLSAAAHLEQWEAGDLKVILTVTDPDGKVIHAEGTPLKFKDDLTCDLQVEIPTPQLWWPNEYGAQPLYRVDVALLSGGKDINRHTCSIGLRTLELRQQPDAWGETFTFVVNGVPIFAKGADWIPADSFPTRLAHEHLEYLLRSAAQTHMNMLRVWGGGYYEFDEFYDLCDRLGILIWQDFTFACAVYPADEAFAENVRIEAVENVRRLRHHPSLALWCGNNEMEQGWVEWIWNKPDDPDVQRLKYGYDRMYHHMLPAVTAAEDPDRPYWPSSPSSGIPFADPNSQQRGDTHFWDVWHKRKPFSAYHQSFPHFMSEFGFQSLPPYKTIQTYAAPEEQNMTSYVMEHHQRSGNGNSLIISQMADNFRMPKDFPSLAYLSMVLQAEGIRYGVEHWRRNMERVSGTLYWQLNDCWPVASWSSIDYFGRWKALHYAAKRFYAPVLLSVDANGRSMAVHVTSDLTEVWEGQLHWRLETLEGKLIEPGQQAVLAAPLADTAIVTLDFTAAVPEEAARQTVLVCELWHGSDRIASCVSAFVPIKHLTLGDPAVKCDVSLVDGTLSFRLASASLARFVELSLDGADVVFSDNYFDLPASQTVQVSAPLPSGWTLEQARKAVHIQTLYDSYV